MALPDPPEHYGLPADAIAALPARREVVYRVLRDRHASKDDFRSDEMLNRPIAPRETWIEHTGLSVFDDLRVAVALLARFPVYVAEVELPSGSACSIAKTGQPHHFTIWGDRKVLFASVRTVYLQKYTNAPFEPRP